MFALNLLGGAAFHGLNGPVTGKAAHKRRVALLAILAVARGRTVGRERLIGLLWADHRTAAARHLLSESLYVLRKELGPDAFVSASDEVGLNADAVQSDVEQFELAVERGAVEEAARLYRGPFLDGFFVPGAVEFEQWAESERARLARSHSRALECLADVCEREGRPDEAAEWWRRLVVLDPSNSRVGMRLMTSLDAAGERAAALWFAQSHVVYLDAELGVDPDDDFLDLVERLKTEPVRVPRPPRPVERAPPGAEASTVVEETGAAGPVRTGGPEADVFPDGGAAAAPAPGAGGGEEAAEPSRGESGERPAVEGLSSDGTDGAAVKGAAGDAGDADSQPLPDAPIRSAAGVSPERSRWRRRWMGRLAMGTVVGAMLGAVLALGGRGDEPAPPVAPGYDPRRIAVLYFDDDSRGGELGYLASGLTESLIHVLSEVPALEVVSRNGVKPYRQGAVPFARMVGELQAGTVVEGSVQRSGDSVRVTVDLVDSRTQARVESRTLTRAVTDVFALEDALADSVSVFLRRRVGAEVRLRRTGAETRSAVAWRQVLEGEQAVDDAGTLLRSDDALAHDAVLRLLGRADSLLAAAGRSDPAWMRPTVQRGWVALRRAPLVRETAASQAAALAYAERALTGRPGDPLALELRGSVLFAEATAAVDSTGQSARVDAAERDLRAAVQADPTLATAWNQLSQVMRYRGRAAESLALARRALNQDAWLEGADAILARLYFGALYAADYPEARALCGQGQARFPGDWRFVECRLTLLRADPSHPAAPDEVAALLAELDRVDPPDHARRGGHAYSPVFRLAVGAAVLAGAGHADSARAMLARARNAAAVDPEMRLSLAYDEAIVYLRLGRPDSARALLEWSLTRRPAQRAFAARDPLLRWPGRPTAGAARKGAPPQSPSPS